MKSAVKKNKESRSIITVDGMNDILVRYSKCCHPIPGDPVVGFITRGRGIGIHRADCERAFELDQDRKVDVDWTKNTSSDDGRIVKVRVVSQDISGLLKNMSDAFLIHGVNIHNAHITTTKDLKAICNFEVSVKNTSQLGQVIQTLQKIKGVIGVTRVTKS